MTLQQNRGFTLIELVSALSIVALLLTLGIHSTVFIQKIKNQNAVYDLTTFLQLARNLAASSGHRTFVCSISSEDTCTNDWSGSSIGIVIDKNGNRQKDHHEVFVHRWSWNTNTLQITWVNRLRDPSITFQPHGIIVSNGTLTLKDKHGAAFCQLIINNGGRVRFQKIE